MQKLRLVMKKYSRATKRFTFLLEAEGADELMAVSPAELFNNEDLKLRLNSEQREQVAYMAGLQYAQEIAAKLIELKESCIQTKKSKTNPVIKRNESPKNI